VYPGVLTGEYTPEEVMDFQPAQEMPKVQIIEHEDPVDGLALYVPDADGSVKLYKMCAGEDEWKDVFLDLFGKVGNATKLSAEQKADKINGLKQANEELYQKLFIKTEEVENGGEG
jgi:hypothetical protein